MKRILAIVCLMFTFSVSFASGGGATNEHKQSKENFVQSVAVTPSVAQMTVDTDYVADFVVSDSPAPIDVGWSSDFNTTAYVAADFKVTCTIPESYRICDNLDTSNRSINKNKYTEIPIHFNRKC